MIEPALPSTSFALPWDDVDASTLGNKTLPIESWFDEQCALELDASQNLITTAYDLDTLAALKIFADEPLVYEPVAYSVKDPSDPDAPVFEASTGYFDITNKVYVKPQILETSFGSFPACFFSPDVLIVVSSSLRAPVAPARFRPSA